MSCTFVRTFRRSVAPMFHGHWQPLSSSPKLKPTKAHCIISCKRPRFDYYAGTIYDNLQEVPLASKGWTDNKSKGDVFTIHPTLDEPDEHIPLSLLEVNPALILRLELKKITKFTHFQAQAFPLVTQEQHLMIAAETGCGKTLSYLVPIVQSLIGSKGSELNSPKALVVVPNRELAYQVGDVAQDLAEAVGLTVKVVVGGRTKKFMFNPDFEEVDLLVATPGALSKLSTVGVYRLGQVLYTVFDEADTLLDNSFIEKIGTIVKRVPQSKIILVTATMPRSLPDVLKPIESSLQQLISPKIHKPLLNITQKFMRLGRATKSSNLLQIAKNNKNPMLVFTNRNETSNWLAMFLRENGVPCSNINGDMNYAIRIEQWNNFIEGKTKILSATDVGSRGLDTTQVRHVLNYDFPLYAADYLHRTGRVGRLGAAEGCKVTNFISGPGEVKLTQQIELAIRRNKPLTNVDGNITNIIQKKIQKGLREAL